MVRYSRLRPCGRLGPRWMHRKLGLACGERPRWSPWDLKECKERQTRGRRCPSSLLMWIRMCLQALYGRVRRP